MPRRSVIHLAPLCVTFASLAIGVIPQLAWSSESHAVAAEAKSKSHGCAAVITAEDVRKYFPQLSKGPIKLQEYKQTGHVVVETGCARMLTMNNVLRRTSVSDATIAEPVVVSPFEVALIAKRVGAVTMVFWDDAGNVVVVGVHVADPSAHSTTKTPIATSASSKQVSQLSLIRSFKVPAEALQIDVKQTKSTPVKSTHDLYRRARRYELLVPRAGGKSANRLIVGTIETCKTDDSIQLNSSESRTFRVSQALTAWTESDPDIAEPVVVSEHEFVLIGKKEGKSTVGFTDEWGRHVGLEVIVSRSNEPKNSSDLPQKTNTNVLSANGQESVGSIVQGGAQMVNLESNQALELKTNSSLTRTLVSNPAVAEIRPTQAGFIVWAKRKGNATAYLWDDSGTLAELNLIVEDDQSATKTSPAGDKQVSLPEHKNFSNPINGTRRVECWSLDQKQVWNF